MFSSSGELEQLCAIPRGFGLKGVVVVEDGIETKSRKKNKLQESTEEENNATLLQEMLSGSEK
jgi:hypothetical protein